MSNDDDEAKEEGDAANDKDAEGGANGDVDSEADLGAKVI